MTESAPEPPSAWRLCHGVAPESAPAVAAGFVLETDSGAAVVCAADARRADEMARELRLYFKWSAGEHGAAPSVFVFPEPPGEDADAQRRAEIEGDRIAALSDAFARPGNRRIYVGVPEAFLGPCPARAALERDRLELRRGQTVAFAELARKLAEDFDYDAEALCEYPGQMATRGGLIDIYPVEANTPYRLDFFGDEIESIRSFDPSSQRSHEEVASIALAAPPEAPEDQAEGAFAEHLPDGALWILAEPSELARHHPARFDPAPPPRDRPATLPELLGERTERGDRVIGLAQLDDPPNFLSEAVREPVTTEPVAHYRLHPDASQVAMDRFESEQSARRKFEDQLVAWKREEGRAIHFAVASDTDRQRIEETLADNPSARELRPFFLEGAIAAGFLGGPETPAPLPGRATGRPFALVSDNDFFGRRRRRLDPAPERARPNVSHVDARLDFSELADGDPLVHLQHGICLFRGLNRIDFGDGEKEVVSVEFAEGMRLHVPLHESHLLSRYVGLSKTPPKLAKIGGSAWEKTRRAAERATLDFAAELLDLQARRSGGQGFAFDPDHPWQTIFEEAFPFQETPDQTRAIEATKADMEKPEPMDRLICGDVGYGKTEVAIRAAMKAVLSGKQVAFLAPTTVLCQQHFNTFRERFAEYPVIIEMISRFRSAGQTREILGNAAEGKVDILVGTHRLLSSDVRLPELGLLVVDEEQRFGVRQKERIKRMRANVDILTLSATPIPRTLYLALSGARSMSVIETPPVDRRPIQTIVKDYSSDAVKRAVQAEVARGGQVFYQHNRVDTIQRVADDIQAMMPRIRVAVGHGQMEERELERVMTRFVAGEADVLVCTTIIESGLDIPNCNTLIVEGADRFGLAQLYQIRGRVGRFKRQAYAYLLLRRHAPVVDQARKRLAALRQHNQLGAGFRIAMRDLELRGAGNLLGSEQSGHVAGVGFELYCQLLRQSVRRLKGEAGADRVRAEVQLDFIVSGEGAARRPASGSPGFAALKDAASGPAASAAEASLPPDYIAEPKLRIDAYRRLAMADAPEDVDAMEAEFADRFGDPPDPARRFFELTRVRARAEAAGVDRVATEGERLICRRAAGAQSGAYLKTGARFPRLTARDPISKMREIGRFLQRRARS